MDNLFELFEEDHIQEIWKVVSEWSFYVGEQKIRIKIFVDSNEKYNHSCSHYYHGPNQCDAYRASGCNYETEKECLDYAIKQTMSFYDPNHPTCWEENDSYL